MTTTDAIGGQHDLIRAMLAHVPFDGWGAATIEAAAADLGMEAGEVRALLPNGTADALDGFVDMGDHDMAAALTPSRKNRKG